MKISQLFLGLVACSTAFAYAGIDGISSNESNIKIGAAANASHPGGVAAVSVQAAGAPYNAFTGFSSLKGLAQAFAAQGTSNTNVTVGSKTFNISHIPVSAMPPSHSALGNFNFGQVGTQEVYFGEWWKAGDTPASASHTVYYAGDNTNTTVPTAGTATYTVAGINGSASNLLSGTFTANYGAGTLEGTLTGTGTAVSSLSLDGVAFNPGTAAFAGLATANGTAGVDNSGVVQGQFFGANASALAGIAQFDNVSYNTAFGGAKINECKRNLHVGSFCFVLAFAWLLQVYCFMKRTLLCCLTLLSCPFYMPTKTHSFVLIKAWTKRFYKNSDSFTNREQFVVPSNYLNFKLMDKNIVLSKIRMILPRRYIWQSCKTVAQSHGLFRTL